MNKIKVVLLLLCGLTFGHINILFAKSGSMVGNSSIYISIDKSSPMQVFGASKIESALQKLGMASQVIDMPAATGSEQFQMKIVSPGSDIQLKKEGYRIAKSGELTFITAIDQSGAMYGLMDVAEQIEMQKDVSKIAEKLVNPRLEFRAIKYNLPWHSYRENESLQANSELSKDLNMWRDFLDMMAENRFNALTLWGLHPFPYMIRAKNFPKATPFSDAEMAEWKNFWTALFKMAKERGIDTYMINWNIIVSESFIQNYGEGNSGLWADGKTSPKIEQYTRESVTQVINEYPDLTGLGITLGEAMQTWDGVQMTDWVDKTIIAGIKAADRKIKFIYRAALSGNHQPHRDLIDKCGLDTPESPIMVELKFNWSHGHSSTTLVRAHGGGTGSQYWQNPAPTHHKMAWMIRNEDFFRLRWGEPDFIREHIKLNGQDYVGGYFIGSECLIPAKDIFHKPNHPHINWKYEFEKQWLYYQQWGRLLYDPTTTDAVFANAFNQKFAGNPGSQMVEAYKLSTRTTQRIGQFFDFTWDHSLYIEGFIGNKRTFITLDEVVNNDPTEPNFVSVKEFGNGTQNFGTKVTPLQLAANLEKDNQQALDIANSISTTNETLKCELEDVKAWSYLGLYFAKKIRAAVALNQHKNPVSDSLMIVAQKYWRELVKVTDAHIQPSHLAITDGNWHWKDYQDEVDAEAATCTITTLAGNGEISLSPAGPRYPEGTTVTLTVKPNAGFKFSSWGGDLSGTENPKVITVTSNLSVSANYVELPPDPIPWNETFTYADGITSHVAPTSWTATNMRVLSNEIAFNNVGADGIFTTAPIDISSGPVKVTLKARAGVSLESGQDFLKFYKKVDNGAEVEIAWANGPQAEVIWTSKIQSGSKLKLILKARVSSTSEYYYFDDLSVVSIPNGINESPQGNLNTTQLLQNYPTPFSIKTTIPFYLSNSAKVQISIFNSLGQEIAQLVNRQFPAGYHTINWDATDKSGCRMSGGIYFCRMVTNGQFVQTKKLVITTISAKTIHQ